MRIATRSSLLAVAQARSVAEAIASAGDGSAPVEVQLVEVNAEVDAGVRPDGGSDDVVGGDKQRFVRGVEAALLEGWADAGVHSAKDLPGQMTSGLSIAAVPRREDARDAWVGPGTSLAEIPLGSTVGTASLRRRSQLLAQRPDLKPVELRGNVDTRLRRLREGEVDGLVLAMAGLRRLGREGEVAFCFGTDQMVPAPGQGALVVQTRSGEETAVEGQALPGPLSDHDSERRLAAERATVADLGADCSSPVGVYASIEAGRLRVSGFVGLADGSEWLRDGIEGDPSQAEAVGRELARRMNLAGAGEILDRAAVTGPAGEAGGER